MTAIKPSLSYTLCITNSSVAAAVDVLRTSQFLILDCEGRELGSQGGALSLLAIGTAHAEQIFLFDAVALDHKAAAMTELLQMLGRADKLKIVWDGRMDAVELQATYSVDLAGVLDLQLAEVATRRHPRQETAEARTGRLASHFGYKELRRASGALDNIHVLMGLDRCLLECQLSEGRTKDGKLHHAIS
jgi:exonuclease 3'-5' domain-containing protein 1